MNLNFIETVHASTEAVEETTEATTGDQGVLASLGINGQMFVFQLINFALVSIVLWKMILKPLTSKMTERQKMIDDSIDNAKKVQENLTKSEKEFQNRVDDAKVEANKIMERATTEATVAGDELKVKAKKEIEALVERARKNIRAEKEEVMEGLKAETANLIVAAMEKILKEKMDGKKDQALIEETLKSLRQ